MAQKPSIPKGTRDFTPGEMVNRNYIFDTIKAVFGKYGFLPIETPAMEHLGTLMGKYGEEGDKLLFKILNSGDYKASISTDDWNQKLPATLATRLCDRGLRYDLTVPFARFVVQHLNEISFPFKRYQIQPVWRADRPQKGRYREFYQCDADVVGSDALLNEYELLLVIDEVFRKLNIAVTIKLNNRKILAGIAELVGAADKFTEITVAVDKLDKIGRENVVKELIDKGLSQKAADQLLSLFAIEGDAPSKLARLAQLFKGNETGSRGVEELQTILTYVASAEIRSEIEIDLTLARGLNYYTGAIIEVKANDVEIGSICGGGRYDNLTGVFGLDGVSGVGISFGADRIYDVMASLEIFPAGSAATTRVLFVNFGVTEEAYCLPVLKKIREAGINAEIYPEAAKLKKQMSYANSKGVAYVLLAGESEMRTHQITLKNMMTGEQSVVSLEQLPELIN